MKKLLTIIPMALLGLLLPHALGEEEAAKPDVEIVIEGNDQMKFDKTAFEVKAGQVVKVTLKNVGKLPKAAMGHNWILLKAGETPAAFGAKAMAAKDHDYIPQDAETAGKIIAHTKLLGPGEEDSVTFTAPAAGEYPFLCSFPGHFAIMHGIMTVK